MILFARSTREHWGASIMFTGFMANAPLHHESVDLSDVNELERNFVVFVVNCL